jgi:hypothetical protein
MFTNAVGYLMMRWTLAGGLQGVYIDGGNDPYQLARSPRPKPPATGLAPLVRSWPLLYGIWIRI